MNLSQLNYFKKLAEVLHYTRAAQELFITQPTLSGAISSLEKELGAPLFERNGRSVLLTPYGEVFYEHVCLALRAIDDGVAAVSARSSASFGTVNLGTTFTTQDHYLPSLIRDFEEAFDKRVIVKVSQGFTNYLTEQLHRGTLVWPSGGKPRQRARHRLLPGEALRAGPLRCATTIRWRPAKRSPLAS